MRPGEASPRPPPWGSSVDAPAQREPAGWGGSLPGTGLPGRTPHGLCAGPGCREPEPQAVWTAVGLLTRPPAWGRWWESVPAGGAGSTWAADARELPGFPSLCGALLSQGAKCLPQRRPWVSARGRVLFCSDARAICVPPASGCLLGLFLLAEGAMGSQQRVRCDRLAAAFVGLLVPVEGEHPTLLILGVLLALRYLVPLLQQQVKDTSLKGSFGVTRKEMEVSPSMEQLVQVGSPRASLRCLCRQDQRSETRLLWKRSSGTENRELGLCILELELLAQTLGHDPRSSTFVWWDSGVKQRCSYKLSKMIP